MEYLQHLLDGSTVPILTAFLLGLLTAVSPCPLATNIAAVGYISKDLENRRRIFFSGLLYTLGRVAAYTLLGAVLIAVLRAGGECFRHSEGNRQMGRTADRSGTDSDRIVYALRTSAQPAEFRILGARRADGAGWRMGCAVARHSFFSGVLPDERRFLFRNAYSDVGRRNGRLSPACRIRCRYGASCGNRRMAAGVQRCRVGRILQPDAGDSKVAHTDCRLAFYSRGHLLWSNLFLLKR